MNIKLNIKDSLNHYDINNSDELINVINESLENIENLYNKMTEEETKEENGVCYLEYEEEEKNALYNIIDILKTIKK